MKKLISTLFFLLYLNNLSFSQSDSITDSHINHHKNFIGFSNLKVTNDTTYLVQILSTFFRANLNILKALYFGDITNIKESFSQDWYVYYLKNEFSNNIDAYNFIINENLKFAKVIAINNGKLLNFPNKTKKNIDTLKISTLNIDTLKKDSLIISKDTIIQDEYCMINFYTSRYKKNFNRIASRYKTSNLENDKIYRYQMGDRIFQYYFKGECNSRTGADQLDEIKYKLNDKPPNPHFSFFTKFEFENLLIQINPKFVNDDAEIIEFQNNFKNVNKD